VGNRGCTTWSAPTRRPPSKLAAPWAPSRRVGRRVNTAVHYIAIESVKLRSHRGVLAEATARLGSSCAGDREQSAVSSSLTRRPQMDHHMWERGASTPRSCISRRRFWLRTMPQVEVAAPCRLSIRDDELEESSAATSSDLKRQPSPRTQSHRAHDAGEICDFRRVVKL
jgi:hypothetical protein